MMWHSDLLLAPQRCCRTVFVHPICPERADGLLMQLLDSIRVLSVRQFGAFAKDLGRRYPPQEHRLGLAKARLFLRGVRALCHALLRMMFVA